MPVLSRSMPRLRLAASVGSSLALLTALSQPAWAFLAEDSEVACEFETFDGNDMTEERLERHFAEDAAPEILTGLTDEWPAREKWTIEQLAKDYGHLPVSSSEMTNGFRAMWDFSEQLYVRDIVNASLIFFTNKEMGKGLPKDMGPIPTYLQRHSGLLGMSVGAPGAYAKHHDHHPSWFAQIKGRKLWVVTAPHTTNPWTVNYPDVCNMPEEAFVGLDVKRCIAQPGDVLYLPPKWGHSTCNLDHAISAGVIGPFHNSMTFAVQNQNFKQLGQIMQMDEWKQDPSLAGDAIVYAAKYGHAKVASVLLRNGANVKGEEESGVPPVLEAAARGHVSMVQYLEQRGGEAWPDEGTSAFDVAALNGHMAVVEDLYKACEACVKEDLGKEKTPLHHAVQEGHIPVVDFLVQHDNSTPAENRNKQLLYLAAENGHVAGVDRLMQLGADPTDVHGSDGGQVHALHVSAINGHFKVVDRLLLRGIKPDAVNPHNDQAIHQAAMMGVAGMVSHLVASGADPKALSGNGATAFQLAQLSGHKAVVDALSEDGGAHDEL